MVFCMPHQPARLRLSLSKTSTEKERLQSKRWVLFLSICFKFSYAQILDPFIHIYVEMGSPFVIVF